MKSVASAFYILGCMFLLSGARFGWFELGDLSVDTLYIIAFILLGAGSILAFMPGREK